MVQIVLYHIPYMVQIVLYHIPYMVQIVLYHIPCQISKPSLPVIFFNVTRWKVLLESAMDSKQKYKVLNVFLNKQLGLPNNSTFH
jgi:hypothetical protein